MMRYYNAEQVEAYYALRKHLDNPCVRVLEIEDGYINPEIEEFNKRYGDK